MPNGEDGLRDGYRAVGSTDVSDDNPLFVSRRLESFIGEMRTQLQDFGTRLDTMIGGVTTGLRELKAAFNDINARVDHVEDGHAAVVKQLHTTVQRVDSHEKQIKAIKARLPKPNKKARRK